MFIGEGPGEFEDVLGVPFVGQAGHILNQLIKHVPHQFEYLITNVVCCRPMDLTMLDDSYLPDMEKVQSHEEIKEHLSKLNEGTDYQIYNYNRDPTKPEMEACRSHIFELIDDFDPHGIVYLGKIARDNVSIPRIPGISLTHPAAILRQEYRLLPVLKEAHKLELFIERLSDASV